MIGWLRIERRGAGSRPWKIVRGEDPGQIVRSAESREAAEALLTVLIGRPRRSDGRRRAQRHRDRRINR